MPDDIYITTSGTPEPPIVITVSGSGYQQVVISTTLEPAAPVRSVNSKIGFVVLDKSDIGLSNVENVSITGASGYLQYQINNLDLNYASQIEFNNLSGQLVNTGNYLYGLIYNISSFTGNFLNLFYPLNNNPSGYLTSGDIANFITGFNSGDYVLKSETGIFALKIDLDNSGAYLYQVNTGISGSLQSQINILNTNPSGFITGFNSGDYVLNSETGAFSLKTELNNSGIYLYQLNTGISGNLQLQINNLNSNTGNFALQSDLTQTGFNLFNRDFNLSGSLNNTGSYLINEIENLKTLAIAYAIAL